MHLIFSSLSFIVSLVLLGVICISFWFSGSLHYFLSHSQYKKNPFMTGHMQVEAFKPVMQNKKNTGSYIVVTHSSLDHYLNSLRFTDIHLYKSLLRFHHNFRIRSMSRLWLGHYNTLWLRPVWSDIATVILSVQRTFFQKTWDLFICNFIHLSCAVFFLEKIHF